MGEIAEFPCRTRYRTILGHSMVLWWWIPIVWRWLPLTDRPTMYLANAERYLRAHEMGHVEQLWAMGRREFYWAHLFVPRKRLDIEAYGTSRRIRTMIADAPFDVPVLIAHYAARFRVNSYRLSRYSVEEITAVLDHYMKQDRWTGWSEPALAS